MRILSFIILIIITDYLFAQDSQSIIDLEPKQIMKLDTNDFNIFPESTRKTKVGLVLSGGGARGLTQIGVLKTFEKYGIEPDIIAGTSIGALIGGLYSTGYTATELEEIMLSTNWAEVLELSEKSRRSNLFLDQKKIEDRSLITLSFDKFYPVLPSSLSNGQYILDLINKYTFNARFKSGKDFSNLRYNFSAVATNIENGKMEVLNSGNLSEVIKASITLPLVYEPTKINNKNLVDGGLTANIPVDVAKEMGSDIVIAVNSTSPLREANELINPINTADQILSITIEKLNRVQLANADFIIKTPVGNHSSSDFSNPEKLIRDGEIQTERNIQELLTLINTFEDSKSEYYNDFITDPEIIIVANYIEKDLSELLISDSGVSFLRYTEIERKLKSALAQGYYKSVYAEVSRENGNAYVKYFLNSNPELLTVELNRYFPGTDSLIADFMKENSRRPVNRNSAYKLYCDLLGKLRTNGYSLVDISRFYLEDNGILKINLTNGEYDSLIIRGNNSTAGSLVLREISIPGDKIVKIGNVMSSIKNLYSTNLFKQVSISPVYYSTKYNLEVCLVEKSTSNLRFSFRSDNERNLQIFVDVRDENIFNSGQEAGISFAGGIKNRELEIELHSDRFFNTLLTYNLSGFHKFDDRNSYSETKILDDNDLIVEKKFSYRDIRTGISFLLGTQLERLGMIYGSVKYEKASVRILDGNHPGYDDHTFTKFRFGGIVDSRDRLPFPTEGTEIDFYYETSQSDIGASLSFSKLFIGIEQFIKLNNANILIPSFNFGFADNTTPFIEQYSLGGENSFYGMAENQLTGRQLMSASLEYRYTLPFKLFFDTYLSVRYDIGNAWEQADAIRFKDLRHGLGTSISFDTPIGKSSFAVGRTLLIRKGLTSDSFIFGPYTFYYSLGYSL